MRAPRHYPNIFFSFPFLQCTSICNYIVASHFLLVSPKKPSVRNENLKITKLWTLVDPHLA